MSPVVDIPLDRLTDRQVNIHLISLFESQVATLQKLEKFMADLTSSVADLQGAVDSVAVRWASQMVPLTEALAAAQAAADSSNAELAEALTNAQTAADAIQSEVTELNNLGAEPEVPVETVPVEELPPAPSEFSS